MPVNRDIPIVLGGEHGKTFDRIARYGNGWFAAMGSAPEIAKRVEVIRQKCDEIGRDFSEIEISCLCPFDDDLAATAAALEEVGVARGIFLTPMLGDDSLGAIENIGRTLG